MPDLESRTTRIVQQRQYYPKGPHRALNLHLSALGVLKYFAKRWKIEQMINDLKRRLGFRDYQPQNVQTIQRHVASDLVSYCALIFLKILQWLTDKKTLLTLFKEQMGAVQNIPGGEKILNEDRSGSALFQVQEREGGRFIFLFSVRKNSNVFMHYTNWPDVDSFLVKG